ncbi:uncharacterized protein [Littorina saxatilis]|uniref:Uncharacterized protein n=1 Tax=Littorina saxatilis TaxID=31220 RepID=A0AAN9BKV9_9CAEN
MAFQSVCVFTALSLLALAASVLSISCPETKEKFEKDCEGRVGCYLPTCEGDEFAAIQCLGSRCLCVTAADNARIGDYEFEIGVKGDKDCACAREEDSTKESKDCKDDGGY